MSKEELLKYLIAEIDLIMHDKDYRFENANGTWYSRESCRDLTNEEMFEELRTELRQFADLEAKLAESEKQIKDAREAGNMAVDSWCKNRRKYEAQIAEMQNKSFILYSMLYETLEKQGCENVTSQIDQMTGWTYDKEADWLKGNRNYDQLKKQLAESEKQCQECKHLNKKIELNIKNKLINENQQLEQQLKESESKRKSLEEKIKFLTEETEENFVDGQKYNQLKHQLAITEKALELACERVKYFEEMQDKEMGFYEFFGYDSDYDLKAIIEQYKQQAKEMLENEQRR